MKTARLLSMILIMINFFALYCNYATLDGIKRIIGSNWYYMSLVEFMVLFLFLFSCFFQYTSTFYIQSFAKELFLFKAIYELYFYKEQIKSKSFCFMLVLYDIVVFISLLFDIIIYSSQSSKEKKNKESVNEGIPLENKNTETPLI